MIELKFLKTKYGKELLIDCLKISETEDFLVNHRPSVMLFYEIYFITKGTGTFIVEDVTIPYQIGTIIFSPPNRRREWNAQSETDAYCILFDEEFIGQFFNDNLFVYRFQFFHGAQASYSLSTSQPEFDSYLDKVLEIKKEICNIQDDSEHLLRSVLYYLLITLNRKYIGQHNIKGELFENIEVLKFIKLVENNFKEKHLVEDYTALMGISRTYLNKKLKAFGTTASDLIKAKLLREAKKELHYSNLSVSEIAYKLNFSEPANFIRFFKKMTSITPNQFRQEFSK